MTQSVTAVPRLLVVSRDPSVFRALCSIGESNCWHLETAGSGWEALERIQSGTIPNLLLLETPRGDGDSMHVLRWIRRLRPDLRVIVLSEPGDAMREKEALRLGANDFFVRPFAEKQLESAIRAHLASEDGPSRMDLMVDSVEQLGDDTFFVGASPVMQKLRAQAELLAQTDVPVLITGEAGSGRDTVARLVHTLSIRSGCRFLKVNCAALPGDLLERELFGNGARSSTGDRSPHFTGKLELCDRGTLFLDEIVEMPFGLQQKLLHFLETKQFSRPGGDGSIDVNVRILVTADTDIDRALSEKRLREDLYYRLSTFIVHIPPLRQRQEDIPFLLQHFMHKAAKHYSMLPREFSPAVLEACQRYSWPGNTRELESFVKRYLMIGDGDLGLPRTGAGGSSRGTSPLASSTPRFGEPSGMDFDESVSASKSLRSLIRDVKSEAERHVIAATLDKTGWNRKAAARLLKVSYRTILYKIEQYQLVCPDSYISPVLEGQRMRSDGHGQEWKRARNAKAT
jgi:two-component system, NtrC family, response regulator AtoC